MGYTVQPIHPRKTYYIRGLGISVLFIALLPWLSPTIRRFDRITRFSEIKLTH